MGYEELNQKRLELLNPAFKDIATHIVWTIKDLGYEPLVASTWRSFKEQTDLYIKSMENIKKGKRWITSASGGESYHNYGLAADIYPTLEGKIISKPVVYIAIWEEYLMRYGKDEMLVWGGDWNQNGKYLEKREIDLGHYEYRILSIDELQHLFLKIDLRKVASLF